MATTIKRFVAMLAAAALALAAMAGASVAWADELSSQAASGYAKTVTIAGVSAGDTVNVYKVAAYEADYHSISLDNTGGKGFDAYVAANRGATASNMEYLESLSGDDLAHLLNGFVQEAANQQAEYALPAAASSVVAGANGAQVTFEPGYYIVTVTNSGQSTRVYSTLTAGVKVVGGASLISVGGRDYAETADRVEMKANDRPSIAMRVQRVVGSWYETKTVAVGEAVKCRVQVTIPAATTGWNPEYALHVDLSGWQLGSQGQNTALNLQNVKIYRSESLESSSEIADAVLGSSTISAGSLDLKLDAAKLAVAGSSSTFYVVFDGYVNGDICNTNQGGAEATLFFKDSVSSESASASVGDSIKLYSFSLEIDKVGTDGKAIEGAAFAIRKDGSSDSMKFVKVGAGDGAYYRPALEGEANAVTEVSVSKVGEKSMALVKGIDVSSRSTDATYTIEETVVPNGYAKPAAAFNVVMTSNKQSEVHSGTLASCVITASNTNDNALVDNGGSIDQSDASRGVVLIKNTNLASLPTTGGMGTLAFTVGGIALMAVAVGLFFALRRKNDSRR